MPQEKNNSKRVVAGRTSARRTVKKKTGTTEASKKKNAKKKTSKKKTIHRKAPATRANTASKHPKPASTTREKKTIESKIPPSIQSLEPLSTSLPGVIETRGSQTQGAFALVGLDLGTNTTAVTDPQDNTSLAVENNVFANVVGQRRAVDGRGRMGELHLG